MNSAGWGARPLWDHRGITAKSRIVELVDEDAEEDGGLHVWVRLQLRLNLSDEC